MSYRVVRSIERPAREKLALLAGGTTGVVGRAMGASGAMDWSIQPRKPHWQCIGPAITVQLDEPDAIIPILAIELAQPGDVIVVAAGGKMDLPCWGGGMTLTAEGKGIAGAVIDGAIGDTATILGREFPVFARGSTPRFLRRNLPGSINVPVVCGGVLVQPGDIVFGAADGVVVIPRDRLDEVIAAWQAHQAELVVHKANVSAGGTVFQNLGLDAVIAAMPLEWEG